MKIGTITAAGSGPILELQEPCIRKCICIKSLWLLCHKDGSFTATGTIVKGQWLNPSALQHMNSYKFYAAFSCHSHQISVMPPGKSH